MCLSHTKLNTNQPGTHSQEKTKKPCFAFFTKNVKMKTNHPKTFIQHQFLWEKLKLEKLASI